MKNMNTPTHCQNCGELLIQYEHQEPNGPDDFDIEMQSECPNGCAYPTMRDEELTGEELAERGKVDTMTEYGIARVGNDKGSIIL